jgi:hypothetical protein
MTERSLQGFFDRVHANQNANRINFAKWYQIIEQIDDCFVRAVENLSDPKPVMSANLLLRCQYAFKTAAGMALAGQVVEVFLVLRSVLEYAGYCLVISKTPSLEGAFLGRHTSTKAMEKQKKAFKISAVRSTIAGQDRALANHFDHYYQRSIDFGGHPNPHAALSAMMPDEREGLKGFTVLAISTDPTAITHALLSTAQVGLTALCVLQHVFKERFESLGIRQEIDSLKNTGML